MYEQMMRDVSSAFRDDKGLHVHVGIGDATGGFPIDAIRARVHAVIPPSSLTLQAYGPGAAGGEPPVKLMLDAFKRKDLDAIVRGTIPSSAFLHGLNEVFMSSEPRRVAMLATASGEDFFLAPVGIDEGFTSAQKTSLVDACIRFLPRIGITPSFFMLSAGRAGDRERHEIITRSIETTVKLVQDLEAKYPGVKIVHGEILVEKAIESGCNVIIAPDGVSGNLIYRTLVHLGAGASRGAWYLDDPFPGPVMDTSRAGPVAEYAGAILLAARSWLAGEEVNDT